MDYISREALLRDIDHYIGGEESRARFSHWVQIQPAADVREVKRGRWIEGKLGFHCSVCKKRAVGTQKGAFLSNYCPNCGAKMEEQT